ncbi:MAG TPA: EVE domain-containing protein [Polyangiaceae bacterium]|jgi:predicted RNA-binding protein with PUA-like domain|nr:EVE domain-containing protein [Polyangiaceae bacterium]
MAKYWLLKSEPDVYSIADLARDGRTMWDGVRNYQARNLMRDDMRIGDLALFYHSSTEPMGVVGLARVCSESYPDPTQFDRRSAYFDPEAKSDDPRWYLVDVEHVETFQRIVTLADLKREKALKTMMVTQRGARLSVQPVAKGHMQRVLRMAEANSSL